MTVAFKFVFVVLLELCLFVEYDLGKVQTTSKTFVKRQDLDCMYAFLQLQKSLMIYQDKSHVIQIHIA